MRSDSIHNWYRNVFEELSGEPQQEVWQRIAERLDEMASVRRENSFRAAPRAAASLLLLAGVLLHIAPLNNWSPVFRKNYLSEKSAPTGSEGPSSLPAPSFAASSFIEGAVAVREGEKSGFNVGAALSAKTSPKEDAPLRTGRKKWTPLPVDAKTEGEDIPYIRARRVQPASLPTGLYAGLTFFGAKSLMLNRETRDGFRKDGLIGNVPVSGAAAGIVMGVRFAEGRSVQAEFFTDSKRGQTYRFYRNNRYVVSQTRLHYSTFNILYKKGYAAEWLDGKLPLSFNLLAGPYYANLELLIRREEDPLRAQRGYLDYDLGVNAGVEAEAALGKKFVVHAGLRTAAGLLNISKGADKVSSSSDRTHNFTAGIDFGVKYFLVSP